MFAPARRLFTKKWKFLPFWRPHSHPRETTGVKFYVAKRTHVPLGRAKFHVNWCKESPLQGENTDFWSVSKFNTGSLPLCGILPVNQERTQDWRKATAQYLCLAHATSYWNVSSSIVSLLKSRNCLVPNKPGS